MAKVVEVWEYKEGNPLFEALIERLKETRKLVIIRDVDNDKDNFIIVGDGKNEETDIKQAQMILELTETKEFKEL